MNVVAMPRPSSLRQISSRRRMSMPAAGALAGRSLSPVRSSPYNSRSSVVVTASEEEVTQERRKRLTQLRSQYLNVLEEDPLAEMDEAYSIPTLPSMGGNDDRRRNLGRILSAPAGTMKTEGLILAPRKDFFSETSIPIFEEEEGRLSPVHRTRNAEKKTPIAPLVMKAKDTPHKQKKRISSEEMKSKGPQDELAPLSPATRRRYMSHHRGHRSNPNMSRSPTRRASMGASYVELSPSRSLSQSHSNLNHHATMDRSHQSHSASMDRTRSSRRRASMGKMNDESSKSHLTSRSPKRRTQGRRHSMAHGSSKRANSSHASEPTKKQSKTRRLSAFLAKGLGFKEQSPGAEFSSLDAVPPRLG